jgi:hypothetical protein
MAKLKDFKFIGTLGDVTAYTMKGVEGVVVRRKSSISKERWRKDPAFANPRRCSVEFGGRGTASRWINLMLHPQKAMADHGLTGRINAALIPIQKLDTERLLGERSIMLSRNPHVLQGFSLNKEPLFDTMVRTPLDYSMSRDNRTARVHIPALVPGINFYVPQKYAMYQVVTALGIIPDLFYRGKDYGYIPTHRSYEAYRPTIVHSEWYPVLRGSSAATLDLAIADSPPPDQSFSLILSVGICFGAMEGVDTITQIRRAGGAKILAMA